MGRRMQPGRKQLRNAWGLLVFEAQNEAEYRSTHFCPRLIFWCHLRQILVGANMRPDLHMLPKAA